MDPVAVVFLQEKARKLLAGETIPRRYAEDAESEMVVAALESPGAPVTAVMRRALRKFLRENGVGVEITVAAVPDHGVIDPGYAAVEALVSNAPPAKGEPK